MISARGGPKLNRELKDRSRKLLLGASSSLAIAALLGIYAFLIRDSYPALRDVGLEMFISDEWYPVWEPPGFGMRALIINSLLVTLFGTAIVTPVAYLVAVYLHGFANRREKEYVRRIFEYLSGMPSVVIAFVFLMNLSPLFPRFGIYSPQNFLLALVGLFFLTIPVAVTLILESLDNVPVQLEEASAALGASEFTTYTKVTTRAAIAGILNAVVLTANRIVGETIVVLLLGGGASIVPRGPFDPMRTLTAAIASEMPETPRGSTHFHVLFTAGLILIIFSTIFELISVYIVRRYKR